MRSGPMAVSRKKAFPPPTTYSSVAVGCRLWLSVFSAVVEEISQTPKQQIDKRAENQPARDKRNLAKAITVANCWLPTPQEASPYESHVLSQCYFLI